jgi:predicted 2-oxoglutarate/Fe(II)-dependent dioxygenase YbiX
MSTIKQDYVDSSWPTIPHHPVFSLVGYLPKEICSRVISEWPYGGSQRHETEIGWSVKYFTSVIPLESKLNEEVDIYLRTAWEQAIKHYDVDIDMYEPYEVKKYVQGDSISKHLDIFYKMKPTERKLTMVVQLSENTEYEGGDLTIAPQQVADRTIGTVTVFPSFHVHGVNEITAGTRWSLICWAWGKYWK